MDGGEPDKPVYKVIQCQGPTNTRVYTVAAYFRGDRLASGEGHSIQQAEMNAAKEALDHQSQWKDLFPQPSQSSKASKPDLVRERKTVALEQESDSESRNTNQKKRKREQ